MKRAAIAFPFAVLLVATGCAHVIPSSPSPVPTIPFFMNSAGPIAAQEADLYRVLLYPSAVVLAVVWGLLIWNIIRYRKKSTDREISPQYYREELIEIIYTAIPVLIVIVLFVLMIGTMRAVAAPAPQKGDLAVTIRAHRWWWEFQYPGFKVSTANELHIPVNTTVQINLDSADVIHSFYVPQLAGKTDVVPGVINHMWLRADKVGEYHGQCAEFCGENHANMRFTVYVDSQADWQAWIANQQQPAVQPQTDQQKTGHDIIANGVCGACHNLDDNGPEFNASAPNLTHLMSRKYFAGDTFVLNEANLRLWLEDNQEMKPGNDMKHTFSKGQINDLLSYLLTLK
jgi:cytochrome c oxidase subunit II